jgi:tubulin-specific chaperone A
MPAPSPLAIATSVLNRLVKEEVSYHKELEQQNAKIAKLEAGEGADDQNADFISPIQNRRFMENSRLTIMNRNKQSSKPRLSSQA